MITQTRQLSAANLIQFQGKREPFSVQQWYYGMSVVATLCDLRPLIVPSAHSARTTGTRALSRILRQSPAFCPPGKTSGLSGIVCRELWGARPLSPSLAHAA